MKTATQYIAEIETTVAGIPCIIGVTYYESVRGSYSYHAASDLDYHGYTDCEWEVLDRKGYKAAWLERKLTSSMRDRIEQEIQESLKDY
jgi:hypothetical protein